MTDFHNLSILTGLDFLAALLLYPSIFPIPALFAVMISLPPPNRICSHGGLNGPVEEIR